MGATWLQAAICVLAFPVLAQPAFSADANSDGKRRGPQEARERVQDSRKLLEEVLMARLTKELALDDSQTVLLVRHLAEHREKMAALRRERAQLVRALREAVRESKDEQQIESLMAQVNAQDEAIGTARSAFQDFEELDLTAWQRARLFLFIQDFENDMRRLLKRAQERRQIEMEGRGNRPKSGPEPDGETAADPEGRDTPGGTE